MIKTTFPHSISTGVIEIIISRETFLSTLRNSYTTMNARRKADYGYLMLYSSQFANYYLQLDEGTDISEEFIKKIDFFRHSVKPRLWICIDFSTAGLAGKLLQGVGLPLIALHFLQKASAATADTLVGSYIDTRYPPCDVSLDSAIKDDCLQEMGFSRILHRPSLFHHNKHTKLAASGGIIYNKSDFNLPISQEPWL